MCAALLGLMAPFACSSSSGDEYEEEEDAGTKRDAKLPDTAAGSDTSASVPDLQLRPAAVYSGFDGTHTYRAPIAAYGAAADLTLTAADPSVVSIEATALKNPGGDTGKYFMLTMKKAGTTQLTASSGGASSSATLTVTSYTTARYEAGEQRYLNGGGSSSQPACTQCHGGQAGIDHSPAALASAEDPAVKTVITTGITIAGSPINSTPPHMWTATEPQLDGLVTYLRALAPKNF
jgi:hypothetical protein